jgi:L-arabinokinase
VSIVSSAPEAVFEAVLHGSSAQASYRFAIFEPTVVQPKAYDVDRLATFNNLHSFLTQQRHPVIDQERQWLTDQHVDCVLIDAPFLPWYARA